MAEEGPTQLIYQLIGCPADRMATEVTPTDLAAAQLLLSDAQAIQAGGPNLRLVGHDAPPRRPRPSLAPAGYPLPATQ